MARGRGNWLSRFQPTKVLGEIVHAIFPIVPKPKPKPRPRKPPSEFKRRKREYETQQRRTRREAEQEREREQRRIQRQRERDEERAERVRRRQQADPYGQIWMEEMLSRPNARNNYPAHFELFGETPGIADMPDDERQELWRTYLENMAKHGHGRYRRDDPRNPWWQASGINPRTGRFDWQAWREAMRYSHRRAA